MVDRRKPPHSGTDVLNLLDRHRLAHTPDHYLFAYEYLSGGDVGLRARVDSVIDGGVRLTEHEVCKLRPAGVPHRLMPDIDHLTLRILDVVGDAMTITGNLNRELVTASTTLLNGPAVDIGPLIATMLRRAEDAEVSFAQAAQRARDIRTELAFLQADGQHDPLTGLPNRKALEVRLTTADVANSCLAIVDIDHLRRINDGHSPAVGDRLLKVVAQVLTEFCQDYMVARWDGGAFAVLLERTDLRTAGLTLTNACAMRWTPAIR